MKIVKRILASPFVLGLMLVFALYHVFARWIAFLRYGGEFMTYTKEQPMTIQDVYIIVENEIKKRNETDNIRSNAK